MLENHTQYYTQKNDNLALVIMVNLLPIFKFLSDRQILTIAQMSHTVYFKNPLLISSSSVILLWGVSVFAPISRSK